MILDFLDNYLEHAAAAATAAAAAILKRFK
jgi:hypothetical protein